MPVSTALLSISRNLAKTLLYLLPRHPCNHLLSLSFPSSRFFSQTQNHDIFTYNVLLRTHSRESNPERAISLFSQIRHDGIRPDHCTFPFVLKACARLLDLHKGQELHSLTLKLGFDCDVFVQNSLIFMYSVCTKVGAARRVFDEVPIEAKDVVSWNSMISGYVQRGRCKEALEVFEKMRETFEFVIPNEVTMVSVLTACARMGNLDLGRKVHGLVVANGFVLDVFVGASLIDMYVKCGLVEDAQKVFNMMPKQNVVCWTSMIAGYSQSGRFKEAIEFFREMQIMNIKADKATIACLASACGHLGALDVGRWVHAYCDRNNIGMNLRVKNALIDMYSKCGDIDQALHMFHQVVGRDVFSWTVMISGLAMNGKTKEALDLFCQMELFSDVKPNDVTFLGVLFACSHAGLVAKGFCYFKSMKEKYNLIPRIEHYGCMIDLLGRANRMVDAEKFIRTMPIEPDVVIWRSLLFACRTNKNVELAELAAKKIVELEPKKCGVHVLLSNVYASLSRWGDVKKVRRRMKDRGIQKQPGCSYIEINGFVHEFFVADKSHPDSAIIFNMILETNRLIRSEGHAQECWASSALQ